MSEVFTVIVVDDHPVVREAVALACETHRGLEFVAEASTAAEGWEVCARYEPDLVVVDLKLPDSSGVDLIRTLKEKLSVKVLVLTSTRDPRALFESWSAGADGFQDKDVGMDELGATMAAIAGGEEGYSEEQRRSTHARFGEIVKTVQEGRRAARALSGREREVLSLISEGLTTGQMATRMGLAHGTVETHLKNLYRKLGVNSRVQALMLGERLGLTDATGPSSP